MNWYQDRNEKIYTLWLAGAPVQYLAYRWNLEAQMVKKIIKTQYKKSVLVQQAKRNLSAVY